MTCLTAIIHSKQIIKMVRYIKGLWHLWCQWQRSHRPVSHNPVSRQVRHFFHLIKRINKLTPNFMRSKLNTSKSVKILKIRFLYNFWRYLVLAVLVIRWDFPLLGYSKQRTATTISRVDVKRAKRQPNRSFSLNLWFYWRTGFF